MDEQLFGEGFRVTVNACTHRVILQIDSYAAARILVNRAGAFTFECSDLTQLYEAVVPTKLVAQTLGAIIGFSAPPDAIHEGGTDEKKEQVLLFSDELTLEMWLRQEFIPHLDVLEDDDLDKESVSGTVNEMVRKIMADMLGNKARENVRRTWCA